MAFFPGSVWALTTQEILHAADQARGNLEGITWTVKIQSVKPEKVNTMTIDIKARGFDIAAETLLPAKYKGNKLLMLNGSMWFYKPGLTKPVPISKRQKLLGDAVYGDIAATNYAEDYTGILLDDQMIEGERCYTLDLRAKNNKGTYDKIIYWISKDRLVGVRADYYTVSGKKFKSAKMEYQNSVTLDGNTRPFISRLSIYDELISRDVTTLDLENPGFEALPDYLFNLNLLRR
jgi:hypothetical protein